jgi:hypothetical protein
LIANSTNRSASPSSTGSPAACRFEATYCYWPGADDHYVPLKQLRRQADALVNARSVTTRVFTAADQASNHCQLGNIGAVSRLIESWLDVTGSVLDRDAAARTPATVDR